MWCEDICAAAIIRRDDSSGVVRKGGQYWRCAEREEGKSAHGTRQQIVAINCNSDWVDFRQPSAANINNPLRRRFWKYITKQYVQESECMGKDTTGRT